MLAGHPLWRPTLGSSEPDKQAAIGEATDRILYRRSRSAISARSKATPTRSSRSSSDEEDEAPPDLHTGTAPGHRPVARVGPPLPLIPARRKREPLPAFDGGAT